MKVRVLHACGASALILAPSVAQPWAQSQEAIGFDAVYRIKDEGFERSLRRMGTSQ